MHVATGHDQHILWHNINISEVVGTVFLDFIKTFYHANHKLVQNFAADKLCTTTQSLFLPCLTNRSQLVQGLIICQPQITSSSGGASRISTWSIFFLIYINDLSLSIQINLLVDVILI